MQKVREGTLSMLCQGDGQHFELRTVNFVRCDPERKENTHKTFLKVCHKLFRIRLNTLTVRKVKISHTPLKMDMFI